MRDEGEHHFVFDSRTFKEDVSVHPLREARTIEGYLIEGYFEKELGGDFFSTAKVPTLVVP